MFLCFIEVVYLEVCIGVVLTKKTTAFYRVMFFVKCTIDIKKLVVQKSLKGLPINVINHQLCRRISEDSLNRCKVLYRGLIW